MAEQRTPESGSTHGEPVPEVSAFQEALRTAPIKVVYGTATFATVGMLAGSTVGVYRDIPAIPAAVKTGLSMGVFSFTFFSMREYAINPLLTTMYLQFPALDSLPSSPRTNNILSTSIAGLGAGTAFSIATKGTLVGAGRAGLTLSLGCTLLQGIVNEASLFRITALTWSEERTRALAALDASSSPSPPTSQTPPTYTRDISDPKPSVPSRETFSERSDRLIGGSFVWLTDSLARISPVTKMEEGDYVEKLEGRLREVKAEQELVTKELEELSKGT